MAPGRGGSGKRRMLRTGVEWDRCSAQSRGRAGPGRELMAVLRFGLDSRSARFDVEDASSRWTRARRGEKSARLERPEVLGGAWVGFSDGHVKMALVGERRTLGSGTWVSGGRSCFCGCDGALQTLPHASTPNFGTVPNLGRIRDGEASFSVEQSFRSGKERPVLRCGVPSPAFLGGVAL